MEKSFLHKSFNALKRHVLKRPFIVGLIVVAAIGGWFWYTRLGQETEMRTTKVVRQDIAETISASGEVTADIKAELRFSTPSKVVWVGVKEGDTVRAGQALASLDKRQVEKNLKKKLLAYMNERWDFEQTHDDYDIEGRQLNDVLLSDKEKRILEKAQFDLDNTVLDVEITNLALEESTIVSPITGTVSKIANINRGEQLTAAQLGTSFIRILDLDSLIFEATVDEVDFRKISIGQNVTITLDAFPDEEFTGAVIFIGREGQKTATGGVVVPVKVALNSGKEKLVTGLTGDAEFLLNQKENVLILPREFVKSDNGTSYVSIRQSDGNVTKVPVTVGLTTISAVEVSGNIQEGQEVVLQTHDKK